MDCTEDPVGRAIFYWRKVDHDLVAHLCADKFQVDKYWRISAPYEKIPIKNPGVLSLGMAPMT